jgi:serine/threonine-protein kinase
MARSASRLLGDRYLLGEPVGEGATCTVSRAYDRVLRRTVAVKVLKPAYALDREFLARFYAEARAAATVAHPNVAAIHDILSDGDSHAIVMEYVDGPSLGTVLARDGPLPEADVVAFARQIAQALAVANERGVLHRDIKPGNVLLAADGVVKVVDFGLAKTAAPGDFTITRPGHMVGSAHYCSPEQAQGRPVTAASDLYSLGIVIYQLRSGEVPFAGESELAVALAQVQAPVPAAADLQAFMSPGLAAIVHRLLQKDPASRYASANELDADLAALERARTPAFGPEAPTIVQARPVPVMRARQSHAYVVPAWAPIALAATVAVLLIVVAAFALRPKADVRVPDLRGRTETSALKAVEVAGLVSAVSHRADERLRSGMVVAQAPAPGAMLRKGESVSVVVSSGLPPVAVPGVVGRSLAEAARTLAAAKLGIRVAARRSPARLGTVLAQRPAPGTPVQRRTVTLVTISAGPVP